MNTATKLDTIDLQTLQILNYRQEILNRDSSDFRKELLAKYSNPDEDISIQGDGTIARVSTKAPESEAVAVAATPPAA